MNPGNMLYGLGDIQFFVGNFLCKTSNAFLRALETPSWVEKVGS